MPGYRDDSEPGASERHHLPQVASNVPFGEHQIPGSDWLGLRTSSCGASLPGGPWEQLSACPPGKVAAAYLTGEPRALGSRVNTPLASLTKSCFPSTQPLIRPPGGKALLLGNVVLSVRSAQRPVRGDCIRSSPICLRKHLQRPPIKVLLFFLGRCLF